MANAFSTLGATPNNSIDFNKINYGGTKGNALSSVISGLVKKPAIAPVTTQPKAVQPKPVTQPVQQPTQSSNVKHVITYSQPTTSGMIGQSNTAPQSPTTPPVQNTQPPVNNTPTYGGLVSNLAQASSQPTQQYTDLTKQAEGAYKQAADFGRQVGQAQADVQSNPEYSLDTGVGLGNRIAQTQGLKMQQLNSTAAGLGNLAGLANTQQGLQQTGLASAAGLAAPILGQYGQANYGIGGNTSGGVQESDPFYKTLQNYAQLRATGQESLIPSSVTGNAVLNDQLTQMTKAINPSYNANTAGAQGQVQGQQYQQVQNLTSALQQGQNLQGQLTDLITTFGLNPSDVNAANKGLQAIAQNTSDPRYQMLQNYVNDIANTYAQVLTPAGGSQTDSTRSIAASMLDSTAKGQSLIQVMHGLDEAAKAKIAGIQTVGNNQTNSSNRGATSWDDL